MYRYGILPIIQQTDCYIKLSANTDTNIDAYVQSLYFHAVSHV